MLGRLRFTIGGLMKVVGGAGVVSAVVAAGARSGSGRIDGREPAVLIGVMVLAIGVDTVRLVRRARAGGPPYGPGWSLRAFAVGMGLVWFCFCVPFLWLTRGEPRLLLWLPLAPTLAGFALTWPINWMFPTNSIFQWPLILGGSTLLIMASARLVARGQVLGAFALALGAAVVSALLIYAVMMSV